MTEKSEKIRSLSAITSQRGSKFDLMEQKLAKIAPNPEIARLTSNILKLVDSPTENVTQDIRLLAFRSPEDEKGTAAKKSNPREKERK